MNPGTSSRPQAAAVGARRDSNKLVKQAAHVGMARKAAIEGDIDKRYRRVPQQFSSSFQLHIEQVIVWAVAGRCFEHPDEMDTAIAALVCQSLQAQIAIEAPHAIDYPPQHVSRQSGRARIVALGRS